MNRRAPLGILLFALLVACEGAAPHESVAEAQAPITDRVDPSVLGYVTFPWPDAHLRVRSIALGCAHACALVAGGGVTCWGRNEFGELGDGTTTTRDSSAPVLGLPPVVEVVSGCASSCARTESGDVWCWGGGDLGEMGDGDRAGHRVAPVHVPGITGARALTASAFGVCAVLDADGHATCWGNIADGAGAPLSSAADATRPRDLALPLADRPRLVASSVSRACVIDHDGAVVCWGAREVQHVDVARTDPAAPMPGLEAAHDLAGAAFLTCASDAQGVSCWGIGVPTFSLGSAPLPPTRVTGLPANAELAVGDDFVCGTARHVTRCAGYGQLVDRTGRIHPLASVASRVAALDGLHAVSAGPTTVCGLSAGGAVRCVAWLSGHEGEPPAPPS